MNAAICRMSDDGYEKYIGMWCQKDFDCFRISRRSDGTFLIEYGTGDNDGSLAVDQIYIGTKHNGKIKCPTTITYTGWIDISYKHQNGHKFIYLGFDDYEKFNK